MGKFSSLPKYTFDWKGTAFLLIGGFLPIFVLSGINVISVFVFHKNLQYEDLFLMLTNAVMWLGAIMAFDYFCCRPETGKKLNFDFSSSNFLTYLIVFPMMFGMMLIAEFTTSKIPITGPFWGKLYDWFSLLMEQLTKDVSVMVILAVIMAPVFEEIVFRGIIQKGLINKGMKPFPAILLSSLIFGIIHGNPWQFVGAVLLGVVLGTVYERTKSLLLPILLHAFNNLCSTILVYYHDTESFSDAFKVSEEWLLVIGIVVLSISAFTFLKLYRIHHLEE